MALNITHAYQITQEDARATYTGPLFISTPSASTTTAVVPLRATIQDATALATNDPLYDAFAGDIRNAMVTFVDRDANNAPFNGCADLSVALLGADPKIGSATRNTNLSVSSTGSTQYTIGIIVSNYYTDTNSADDSVVTVSLPAPRMITGGGYLVMASSSGQYDGDPGTKSNFGFNVKYNKNKTNLQGNVNIIVPKGCKVYQIKSKSVTSLTFQLGPGGNPPSTAQFVSKANLRDITDPLNSISLGGKLTLQSPLFYCVEGNQARQGGSQRA